MVPAFALSFMPEVPQVKQRTTSLRAPQRNKQRTCNLLNAFSARSQDAGSPKDAVPARRPPLPRLGATCFQNSAKPQTLTGQAPVLSTPQSQEQRWEGTCTTGDSPLLSVGMALASLPTAPAPPPPPSPLLRAD